MKKLSYSHRFWLAAICVVLVTIAALTTASYADVGRKGPAGTSVPLAGTQQMELTNITFPAPYNVFEFPQTCGACHGGTIDQQVGHWGNWSGTVMGNTSRSPVFRADMVVVNEKVKALLMSLGVSAAEADGAGNICSRCHMPNAFLSGRNDPRLGGSAIGSDNIQQITLSTDQEGISCEFCHRTIGGVVYKRADLNPADKVWNMLAGISDWPHAGDNWELPGWPETPMGPHAGDIMGIAQYQVNDAMTYAGKYAGVIQVFFSDLPFATPVFPAMDYTGQTYGVYPPGWTGPINPPPPGSPPTNSAGQTIVYNLDGTVSIHFEKTVPPPPDPSLQAISPEHSTHNAFIRSPDFCGVCHDRTLPPANLAMPRAKEYTEWKLSTFGNPISPNYKTCQDCHMPTLKHEYSDSAPVGLNADPTLAGWYPYAKDRNPMGGTALHKFPGANYNLAQQFKILYPEVDMEVIGAPTGRDTRMFPGIQSSRDWALDRDVRNSEIFMRDAAKIEITQPPTETAPGSGIYEVKVKVTNTGGAHRFPSGLPDGRRAWIGLTVKNAANTVVYESGHYNQNTAILSNDAASAASWFKYAQSCAPGSGTSALNPCQPLIDAANGPNAVQVYERRTGHPKTGSPGSYEMSYDLINRYIILDNRIPYPGFEYISFNNAGLKLKKFDPVTLAPSEDRYRYADGQYWDVVTYRFKAASGLSLKARAELYAQTHTRDFVDFLDAETRALPAACSTCTKGPRPEGPPNILDPNYPLTPTYLSDQIIRYWNAQPTLPDITSITQIKNLNNQPLEDTWAGVAYASWLLSGKSQPIQVSAADTTVTAPPPSPTSVTAATRMDPATGLTDPFALVVSWSPVTGAQGYLVWIRYGKDTTNADADPSCKTIPACTASWDRLAVVWGQANASFLNDGLNVAKTYQYKVQAFNEAGMSSFALSPVGVATTPIDLPLFPMNLKVAGVTDTTVTLTWYDQADNETGFIIERQDVPLDRTLPLPNFVEVARINSPNIPGTGGVTWTNTGLLPGRTYNYRVAAYNPSGMSTYNDNGPVAATTLGKPPAPTGLTATVFSSQQIDLAWNDNSGSELGFRVERSTAPAFPAPVTSFLVGPNVTTYSDKTTAPATPYYYRVFAYNASGDSLPSNTASVTTPPGTPPKAPNTLAAVPTAPGITPLLVKLTWKDVQNETGFILERATDAGFTTGFTRIPATGSLAANTISYNDTAVAAKTTYWYRVRAVNAAGSSPYSNVAFAVTPGGIPNAPENLAVGLIGKTFVQLSWSDLSGNEQGFYIERSPDGVAWKRVGTTAMGIAAFQDDTVKSRTTYWYRVQAYNTDGVSAYTNPVTVTTL